MKFSDERQAQVVVSLADVGHAGQPEAYDLALEIACAWTSGPRKFSAVLDEAVLPVLTKSLGRPNLPLKKFYWILAVGKLPHSHLSHKIDLLIEAVKGRSSLRSDAIERLEAILRSHPSEAPNILETRIHNIDPEDVGHLGDLLSVFDSDQIEIVQRLVRKFGVIGARALANHLIAPYPTADDPN